MSDESLWHEDRLLIEGELTAAAGGATFDNIDPSTEEVIGVAANAGHAEMDRAIGAARRAFDSTDWATNTERRVRCIRQLAEALDRAKERFRPAFVAEVGAPVTTTYMVQMDMPIAGVNWVADLAERYEFETDLGESEVFGMRSRRTVRREASGVVAAITPWNYPMQINLAKVIPALAAGNTVVLKAAPDTPWTALVLGRLAAEETDLPPGVLNVISSADHAVGAQLTADPRVDLVSFTGSTATGRAIMAAGAPTIKKLFLELGGKSALIVLDDADIAAAAMGVAFQITSHAGQGCAITSRLLVPERRRDEIVEQVVAMIQGIPYGDPSDPANLMGPLVSKVQRERVLGYIERGLAEGATAVIGGGRPAHLERGWYVEPTVLVDVQPDHTVAQEEIFGPVLSVLTYRDDDDAVAIANNSIYGLSGGVFGSPDRARAIANRIRTGTIGVNGGMYYGVDSPFGGYKQSGIGREMGVPGFEEYLEIKTIAVPA